MLRRMRLNDSGETFGGQTVFGFLPVWNTQVLFRQNISPFIAGNELDRHEFDVIWADRVDAGGGHAGAHEFYQVLPDDIEFVAV